MVQRLADQDNVGPGADQFPYLLRASLFRWGFSLYWKYSSPSRSSPSLSPREEPYEPCG